jgi:hypothetical protein
MARDPGIRFLHVFYKVQPDDEGVVRPHDLRAGNECWCEPKCIRAGKSIIVVHDPEDGILVVEDANGYRKRPERPPQPPIGPF